MCAPAFMCNARQATARTVQLSFGQWAKLKRFWIGRVAEQGNPIAYITSDAYTQVAKKKSGVAKAIWEQTPWK
jgi:hypothetical protein